MDTQEKKPIYKKWWFWVLAIIIIGVIANAGKKGGNSNADATASGDEAVMTQAQKDSVSTVAKDDQKKHTFSARELYNSYESNEVAADNNFKDKNFWVTGTVKSIGKDIADRPYVELDAGDMIMGVQCFVTDANSVSKISKGETITLHGTGGGKLGNVFVNDCEVVPNL